MSSPSSSPLAKPSTMTTGAIINPDVDDTVRTEESDTVSSTDGHTKTTSTVNVVTIRTPTCTEVIKTTVAVTKDTVNGKGPLRAPTLTRTTTKETTIATATSVTRNVEEHSTTVPGHDAELSVTSFDVL